MKTVFLGMSGGVDSSVAAALLKQQGYHVVGLFMRNWEAKNQEGFCTAEEDFKDAEAVCRHLDLPIFQVNFAQEYQDKVFSYFLSELKKGRTPNPDIFCNREIKFDSFYHEAKNLGADLVATGHYCQTQAGKLYKGLDPLKDQSYFLSQVSGEVLKDVLFPVGGIKKTEVRRLAKELGLPTKNKKDSTGICFIGEKNFTQFLSSYIAYQKGEFQTLSQKVVGEHLGTAYYTLGQRKGLGLGGPGEPWYVVAKNQEKNIVYVERGDNHPALFSQSLWAKHWRWITKAPGFPFKGKAKVRYRQEDQDCSVYLEGDCLRIDFTTPQRAVTPGQFIVLYDDNECLGGGQIEAVTRDHQSSSLSAYL